MQEKGEQKALLKGGHSPDIGKATQIKPGQALPGAGRPPEKLFRQMLLKVLDKKDKKGIEDLEKIAQALVDMGKKKNVHAIKEIANRLDGQAQIEASIKGDVDIGIVYKVAKIETDDRSGTTSETD